MRTLDLLRMDYMKAWEVQLDVAQRVQAGAEDTLIFVEHPAVLTLGANFHDENLLHPRRFYEDQGIAIHTTDRGGDVTFHGPNQLVIYPIFALERHGKDLHRWIRGLEEAMILTCAEFGVEAQRFPPLTGAWVGDKKIAAIGIKVKRWVSIHGIALNCDNDLDVFTSFVPCGIQDHGVTSLTRESGRTITIDDAKPAVARAFKRLFGTRAP